MGKTILIYAVRPESPETDLDKIKKKIEGMEFFDVLEVKPFMYGMEQIVATFILPEGEKPEPLEEKLRNIDGVEGINQEACTKA